MIRRQPTDGCNMLHPILTNLDFYIYFVIYDIIHTGRVLDTEWKIVDIWFACFRFLLNSNHGGFSSWPPWGPTLHSVGVLGLLAERVSHLGLPSELSLGSIYWIQRSRACKRFGVLLQRWVLCPFFTLVPLLFLTCHQIWKRRAKSKSEKKSLSQEVRQKRDISDRSPFNPNAGFTFESAICLRQMLQYPRQTVHLSATCRQHVYDKFPETEPRWFRMCLRQCL